MHHSLIAPLAFATRSDCLFPSNALSQGFHSEAAAIAAVAVSSFVASGVAECVNTDIRYSGAADYVASATNVLGAVRAAR
jgi:hypothetical protein